MPTQRQITRRQVFGAAMAGASAVVEATLHGSEPRTASSVSAATADPRIRGPFPILSTPFTVSGAVDFDALAEQARFVDSRPPDSGRTEDESRLGTEGLITERAVYADLLTRIWTLQQSGSDPAAVMDAYSKFLLMTNLSETHPGGALRGVQLYLWKKRGVFKTVVSRNYGPGNAIPASPIVSELRLTDEEIAEIECRFEALKAHLKPGRSGHSPM